MNTLEELIYYCNEEKHLGALLLTGEWGCGKTYLIDNDLTEALRDTHFIVRVSFLGVDSVEALNDAVKKQYLMVCTPFLGKLKRERERHNNIFEALSNVLFTINPVGGGIASAVSSVDPLDYIPIEPVVEDLHDKGIKKRVVLVFDDLNRSQLDWGKFVGTINEYCENKGITTIVVGDMEAVKTDEKFDVFLYKMVKEKTIAHTVRYLPDYGEIIHRILAETAWQSPEYEAFLVENEQKIKDVFVGDAADRDESIRKFHNIRSLKCALQEFYRLFELLTTLKVPAVNQYLYSFLVYMVVSRNGVNRDGRPCFDATEEEIRLLYPDYRPELLSGEMRQWIEDGLWEEERIVARISDSAL